MKYGLKKKEILKKSFKIIINYSPDGEFIFTKNCEQYILDRVNLLQNSSNTITCHISNLAIFQIVNALSMQNKIDPRNFIFHDSDKSLKMRIYGNNKNKIYYW